jgi:S-adenosylmethionine:tRNA ribosyltransferase-isomerase
MAGVLRIGDFSYELPHHRIAKYPLDKRDQSKLLVWKAKEPVSTHFYCIGDYLESDSLLIVNNTRVVQARLMFTKPSGATIEIFCLEPIHPVTDVHLSLGLPSPADWLCLIGNAKKWKTGSLELMVEGNVLLKAEKLEKRGDAYRVRFSWDPAEYALGHVLEVAGSTPLPPYLNRQPEAEDTYRYQTIFARDEGSVAAPTAGLHFTTEVFSKLAEKKIHPHYLTLHVGAGTFKPVSSETIDSHQMHREQFSVERSLIELLANHKGMINCVGTTSMRTLESLYWIGANMRSGYTPGHDHVILDQWAPYHWQATYPDRQEAMQAILRYMDEEDTSLLKGETSLIIVPGCPIKMVDALITNFHQPKSTLLLLVAAFAGSSWKQAYQYALDNEFRFLSYGDSCLFFKDAAISAE